MRVDEFSRTGNLFQHECSKTVDANGDVTAKTKSVQV